MDVREIIKHLGGTSEAARKLGAPWPSTITNWIARNKIPDDRIPDIEIASGGVLRCELLNPDLKWHRDKSGRAIAFTKQIETKAA
jgi:DNA-binding transcriptional regulator YdaS (Cro superfamily)